MLNFEGCKELYYEVKSFDQDGNEIDANAYKPTHEVIGPDYGRTIYIRVSDWNEYTSQIQVMELDVTIVFINDDGSVANDVVREVEGGKFQAVTGPFKVFLPNHIFKYSTFAPKQIGFDIDVFVEV